MRWWLVLLLGCSEVHVEGGDAGECVWQPAPGPRLYCDESATTACIAWAHAIAPDAIARCVAASSAGPRVCVSVSACDATGRCRCGASPPCIDGSACVADGSGFVCRACAR